MVYEKKVVAPFERAVLTKAANVTHHNKSQTLRLVQDAIKLHTDTHKDQMSHKDNMIHRQQDMIIEQRKQLLELQKAQN
jgi:hypothetical protein